MVGTKVRGRGRVYKHDLNPGPGDDSPSVSSHIALFLCLWFPHPCLADAGLR